MTTTNFLSIKIDLQATSQSFYSSHQCPCGVDAPIADHLRASKPCVQMLRGEPALEMGGSDDVFILKATLLLRGCPVPFCQGEHEQEDLPLHCVSWWRDQGWAKMGWKGSRQNADSAVIKTKINTFRKNFHKRKREANSQVVEQQEKQSQGNEQRQEAEQKSSHHQGRLQSSSVSCFNCSYLGNLPSHLEETHACLNAYLKTNQLFQW